MKVECAPTLFLCSTDEDALPTHASPETQLLFTTLTPSTCLNALVVRLCILLLSGMLESSSQCFSIFFVFRLLTTSWCTSQPDWHSTQFRNIVPKGVGFIHSKAWLVNPPNLEVLGLYPETFHLTLITLSLLNSVYFHCSHSCIVRSHPMVWFSYQCVNASPHKNNKVQMLQKI